jgi:hypothetical protein
MTILQLLLLILLFKISYGKDLINIIYGKPMPADDRFAPSTAECFLSGYPVPEKLFDALRVDKSIDRFSWIVDDYLQLEVHFKE